jgi:hypothetical protein
MTDELERIWRDTVVAYSRYCAGNCLERRGKVTKKASVKISGALAEI